MSASCRTLAIGVFLAAGTLASAQQTTRVSVDSSGAEAKSGSSYAPAISADGQIVAFYSDASDFVAGDTNGLQVDDIFVHDQATGITELVSVDSSGVQGNAASVWPSISADGKVVAFASGATNLVAGDTNGYGDVFVHDRATGVTERVSVDSTGAEGDRGGTFPSISADGQIVAFTSRSANLVAGDTNGFVDVFVYDRSTGITERVSMDSSGAESNGESQGFVAISADGQIVAFYSDASDLVAGDTNGVSDVFVHDRSTGITERVSVDSLGVEGNGDSGYSDFGASISADGQIVAFYSSASNLVDGDTNGVYDVFIHDRSTGITERVSVDSFGVEGNGGSGYGASSPPTISADGRFVAFYSLASNLVAGDTNGTNDVFVHDRATGITERVSVDSLGAEGNGAGYGSAISANGYAVAFFSYASNLVAGDTNGYGDVFVNERCMIDATWTNYGAGFPGTNGVPSFTALSDPVLGSNLTLDLANSYSAFTFGLFFVGFQQTSIHSALGGDLLVLPAITTVVGLPSGGTSFTGFIPNDGALCGFEIDLQAWEADPGAAKGVSFTQGLELVLGH